MIILTTIQDVVGVVLNVLYFVLALSLVVTIHELGHFAAAKAFGVYCH